MIDLRLGDNKEVINTIPDNSVDMVLTSPPYDNLRTYKDAPVWTWEDFKSLANGLYRVLKQGGVIVWVVGDATIDGSETGTSFRQALYFKEIGFNIHDTMLYKKINFMPQNNNRYEQEFEYMFIFSKGKPKTFNPIKIPCKYGGQFSFGVTTFIQPNGSVRKLEKHQVKDTKYHGNIWEYRTGSLVTNNTKHPAVFPDELCRDMIVSWSNEGDTVLDPFMGSGTSGKIANLLKRNYIGIEISPEYYEVADNNIGNRNVLW